MGPQHSWHLWPGHSCALGPEGGAELSSRTPNLCSVSSTEPRKLHRASVLLPCLSGCEKSAPHSGLAWGRPAALSPGVRGRAASPSPAAADLRTPPETHLSQLPPAQLAGPWGWPGSRQQFSSEQMLETRRGGNLLSLFGSRLPCEVPAGHWSVLLVVLFLGRARQWWRGRALPFLSQASLAGREVPAVWPPFLPEQKSQTQTAGR